jgi:hypothetical protein
MKLGTGAKAPELTAGEYSAEEWGTDQAVNYSFAEHSSADFSSTRSGQERPLSRE